ncbi:MAG: DUF1287 domain-containing protein [Chthoniobacteraceae bacterium]
MRIKWAFLIPALAASLSAGPAEQRRGFIQAARAQIGVTLSYDPSYVPLAYPGGDVPTDRGVCTDVIIRAFRALDLDLQKLVHEDMARAFPKYPQSWGLGGPDRNIDHRRVPNLMRFLERQGERLAVTKDPADYRPGDLVTCMVPGNRPHIMIVSDTPSASDPARYQIIHNIGAGARMEDRLFDFEITGHYRYW